MKYDFETLVDRRSHGSSKWNSMYAIDPTLEDGIFPFSVADMEFKPAPEIIEGLKNSLDEIVLGYTSPTDCYYNAVINWMDKRHGWKVEKDWILTTAGVVTAIFNLVQAYAKEGDGIIILTPSYPPFYDAIKTAGCIVKECPFEYVDGKYNLNLEAFKKLASDPKNTMFILCSPHNPVGTVFTKEELSTMMDACIANKMIVISDEIHHDLVMPGFKHHVLANVKEEYKNHVVTCTAPSKTFNIAGMKASNIIIPNEDLRNRYKEICHKNHVGSINLMAIKGCELAYTKCEGWLEEVIEVIAKNRKVATEFIESRLPKLKVIEGESTYLLWIDFNAYGLCCEELEKFLRHEAKIYMTEGYTFGDCAKGFERMNIGCPTKELEKALCRLETALNRLEK